MCSVCFTGNDVRLIPKKRNLWLWEAGRPNRRPFSNFFLSSQLTVSFRWVFVPSNNSKQQTRKTKCRTMAHKHCQKSIYWISPLPKVLNSDSVFLHKSNAWFEYEFSAMDRLKISKLRWTHVVSKQISLLGTECNSLSAGPWTRTEHKGEAKTTANATNQQRNAQRITSHQQAAVRARICAERAQHAFCAAVFACICFVLLYALLLLLLLFVRFNDG